MVTTEDYVFFWGAQDIYSNFYNHPFYYRGVKVSCSETAFMIEKAIEFEDTEVLKALTKVTNPKQAKALGRKISNYDETIWNAVRFDRMKRVLREKFKNPQLASKLVSTGSRILVEASPYDSIWGIGIGVAMVDATNTSNWGKNLLGQALMEIREELKQ